MVERWILVVVVDVVVVIFVVCGGFLSEVDGDVGVINGWVFLGCVFDDRKKERRGK